VLWIQTDIESGQMHRDEMQGFGNNQMLACDPATGEVRRFLTGPVGCEITGIAPTPHGRTMFVNIQHPGEPLNPRTDGLELPSLHSDPTHPTRYSNWPDIKPGGRPRSATVAIRQADRGPIGT
jgi:secreted PhoX family phosphatase